MWVRMLDSSFRAAPRISCRAPPGDAELPGMAAGPVDAAVAQPNRQRGLAPQASWSGPGDAHQQVAEERYLTVAQIHPGVVTRVASVAAGQQQRSRPGPGQ